MIPRWHFATVPVVYMLVVLRVLGRLFGVDPNFTLWNDVGRKKPRFWVRGALKYRMKTRTVLNGLCLAKPLAARIDGEWAKKISHGFV